MEKNTENVPGPSHLHQHTDKSDPAESSSVAYTHLSILQVYLILSFLYSYAHLWKNPLQKTETVSNTYR